MKKFLSLLCAVLVVLSTNALPVKKAESLKQVKAEQIVKAGKVDAPRSLDATSSVARKAKKAESDYVVITEQPAGELKTYGRGGGHYYVSSQSLYYENQSGTIDVVFGSGDKVYFKDIISGLAYGTWVEGTFNAAKDTVLVPLGQNLRYVSTYDACIAIQLLQYVSGSGFSVITTETEIAFAYDAANDIFELQGTGFTDVSLAGVWTDDGTIQNYGDYESVYSPYEANVELVTLPDGLIPVERPIEAAFYASLSDYQADNKEDVSTTVKVAVDGTSYYIQGLSHLFPESWMKGELVNGEIEFPITYLGKDASENNVYAMGYSSSGVVGAALAIIDAEGLSFEIDGYLMLSTDEFSNTMSGIYEGLLIGERPELVVLPDGLTPVEMPLSGTNSDGQAISGTANVAIAEDGRIFIQGLSQEVPSGWIAGQFNATGDTAIFPFGQYVGVSAYYQVSVYLLGDNAETESVSDIVFAYDAKKNVFTAQNVIYDNAKKDAFYYIDAYSDVVIGSLCDGLWIAADQGYENGEDLNTIEIGDGITGVFAQETGSNAPKYYTSGTAARMYANNTLTITATQPMGKIIITMTGSAAQKLLEANVGSYALEGNVGTWTGEAKEVIFTVPSTSGSQARIQKIEIFFFDPSTTPVTVPDDLETATYKFVGIDTYYGSEETKYIQVGFDEDIVYFQGLSSSIPEGWIKGTVAADGSVTLDPCFVGIYSFWVYEYDVIFEGGSMQYDAALDQFTCAEFITVDEDGYVMDEYADIIITRFTEVAATPADPEITNFVFAGVTYPKVNFTIPLEGTNGEDLNPEKLSYIFFTDKSGTIAELVLDPSEYVELTAPMTEIPYTFSDDWDIYNYVLYLNQSEEEVRSWSRLGLQSIYRGAGEENKSNVVWFDVAAYWAEVDGPAEGIEETLAEGKAVKVVRDNQIIILKGDKAFNMVGNRVK